MIAALALATSPDAGAFKENGGACQASTWLASSKSIDFKLGCERQSISRLSIKAGSSISFVSPELAAVADDGTPDPEAGMDCPLTGRGRGAVKKPRRAVCDEGYAPHQSTMSGTIRVEGGRCKARLTFGMTGGGPCSPGKPYCLKAKLFATLRTGPPAGC